eukprot:g17036.t1
MAYAYTEFLSHPGAVQTLLRDVTGWGPRDYWFPRIRSREGAALMFTFVLYPYVYLLARAAFMTQSVSAFEAARVLGKSPWQAFLRVALPMARPAIVIGCALALMETLADYGTVAHFAVPTFTTGIYRSWFSMGDRVAAAQLAGSLFMFVFVLIWIERVQRGKARYLSKPLGYAIPGSIVAVGILIPMAGFDNALDGFMRERFGISTGLLLTGTIIGLIFAYTVRFLAVALAPVESAFERMTPHIDDAARVLGARKIRVFTSIHAPLLKGSILTGALIVFVDVMKELPATLILRPFNFETLATQAFRLASDERLAEAATPSLVIVAVGLVPVYLLSRQIRRLSVDAPDRPKS